LRRFHQRGLAGMALKVVLSPTAFNLIWAPRSRFCKPMQRDATNRRSAKLTACEAPQSEPWQSRRESNLGRDFNEKEEIQLLTPPLMPE
jgi:hypothetical protein